MCDLNCDNLIDLSLDDEVMCDKTQNKTELAEVSHNTVQFIPPSWRNRESLGNNPFDSVQKLADCLNDPFDVAESEACLKSQQISKDLTETELGDLLSLSSDNLVNDVKEMTKNDLAVKKLQDLDLESPPVAFNDKYPIESVSETDTTTPNSSAESSASAKLKRKLEYSKRLLKLSISNSALNPTAIKKDFEGLDDILKTPIPSIFSKAAEFEENLLSAESPLKLIEDEDKLSKELQMLVDLEKKFEADLEMLKIPILNELPSRVIEHSPIKSEEPDLNVNPPILKNPLPNLQAIKSKLKTQKSEIYSNNSHEIFNLIENLKVLISNGEMVNERKKQAGDLLESLTSALVPPNIEEPVQNSEMQSVSPKPFMRQGTFDLDIQEQQEPNADNTQEVCQEIPRCMISSSATYDGETPMERQDLNLPEISPITPQTRPSPNFCPTNMQIDINDIVEQLAKLLINNSADDQSNVNNPTVIVVMNTNQLNCIDDHMQNSAKARSAYVANYLENSINESSPDLVKANYLPRRRSQSLSSHDKIKVVHLPLQPSTLRPMQKHCSIDMDEIEPIMKQPYNDKDTPEFKTPARLRRNSYSSGTPYTAQVGLRKTGFSADTKRISQMRRTQTLDTHHEGQSHAIARPLSKNLTSFKPDLKKKVKPKIEPILRSAGPLKATIPLKIVAPTFKTSPPSPERNIKPKISGTPSTPIPSRRSKLATEIGYPNACSTPAAFTSPLKRTTGPINKPRYSHTAATNNPKASLRNSSTGSLKRRTIAELKAKSPLKARMSNSGLQFPSSSIISPGSSRLSISAGAKISKTSVRPTTSTTAIKPSSRLSSRLSIGGSLLSNRNKENKDL